MDDITSWLGLIVSIASLVVAVIAIIKSGRAQKEANSAQRQILVIEEQREQDRIAVSKRAELRAELRKTPRNTTRLYVINEGLTGAQNVEVSLDGKPLMEHEAASDKLPSNIGPKSEVSCILGTHMTCAPPFDILITWDDASGTNRTYCSTLTR